MTTAATKQPPQQLLCACFNHFFPMFTVLSRLISLSLTHFVHSTTMIDCKILLYELLKKVKTAEMFTTKYFFVFFLSLFSCIEVSLEEEDFCFLSISFKSFILCYIIVHVLHFVVQKQRIEGIKCYHSTFQILCFLLTPNTRGFPVIT